MHLREYDPVQFLPLLFFLFYLFSRISTCVSIASVYFGFSPSLTYLLSMGWVGYVELVGFLKAESRLIHPRGQQRKELSIQR